MLQIALTLLRRACAFLKPAAIQISVRFNCLMKSGKSVPDVAFQSRRRIIF
ncbi:hypothetical protein [Burkholderia ubonensis]|uniref:hypothetical protein n=1 Tax=Burkholderia ubonensis TaxID=101571 RepID=UPI001E2911A1|nr:hypothetical protein [Burkholderia ubonensis]